MNWYKTLKIADLITPARDDEVYTGIGHGPNRIRDIETKKGVKSYLWVFYKNKFEIIPESGKVHMEIFKDIEFPYAKGRVEIWPNGNIKASMMIGADTNRKKEYMRNRVEDELEREYGPNIDIRDFTYYELV